MMGRVPIALHFDSSQRLAYSLQIVGTEFDGSAAEVLFEPMELCRTGYRHNPRFLRQQPGKSDLRIGDVLLLCDCADRIDQSLICFARISTEARHCVPEVFLIELRLVGDRARQEALSQWAKWD